MGQASYGSEAPFRDGRRCHKFLYSASVLFRPRAGEHSKFLQRSWGGAAFLTLCERAGSKRLSGAQVVLRSFPPRRIRKLALRVPEDRPTTHFAMRLELVLRSCSFVAMLLKVCLILQLRSYCK